MTKVIDVNLGQILDIHTECKSGGLTSDSLEQVQSLLEDTSKLISFGNGRAYRKLEELIDEIDDNVRGIINNVDDLGTACGKYYDKMIDLAIPPGSIDDNMFVSDDLGDIKKKYKDTGYQSKVSTAKSAMRTVNNNAHLSLGDGAIVDRAKVRNFNTSVENYCDWIIPKLKDLEDELEDTYDKLEDLEDFKSHEYNEALHIGAKIAVATGIAVVTTVAAAALLPEMACVAAVIATEAAITAAGTAVVSGAKHYRNGSDVKEAATEGTVDGVKAGTTSAVFGGGITAGMNKGSNVVKGVKGLDDEVTSTADILLKKSEYNGQFFEELIGLDELTKNNFGLSATQKNYLIKESRKDFYIKGGLTIGGSGVENKIDDVEYAISSSELYDEMQQVLKEMNIEVGGDDIWQDI